MTPNDTTPAQDEARPADVERVAHKMAGAHVCAYEIRPRLPKRRRPRRS